MSMVGSPVRLSAARSGAVGVDLPHRGEHVFKQGREVLPAPLVEPHDQPSDLGVGVIESARDAGIGRVRHDVAQRAASVWRRNDAGSCAHCSASSQGWMMAR